MFSGHENAYKYGIKREVNHVLAIIKNSNSPGNATQIKVCLSQAKNRAVANYVLLSTPFPPFSVIFIHGS